MAWSPSKFVRGRDGQGLLLHEILAALEEEDDGEIPESVAVSPPDEGPGADSDEDSDKSDGEAQGNLDRLPSRVLRSQVLVRYSDTADKNVFDFGVDNCSPSTSTERRTATIGVSPAMPPPKRRCLPETVHWLPHDKLFSSKIPEREVEFLPNAEDFLRQQVNCPLDAFTSFFSHDLVFLIVEETNRYAGQHLEHNLNVSLNEILTVLGIMLLSGYHSLPHKRMYWQTQPDVHVSIVAEAMRRNRFDEILRYLHIADNSKMDGTDRMYKVRPLFDHLNSVFKQISVGDSVSIDESMIPYFGRHSAKQFIRGKPIRFGFKLWVAADPSGYIFHVEPYCGTYTRFPTTGYGQGNDVVMGLVDHLKIKKGIRLYFDNFFTSIALLRKLKSNGIGATGTLRENRCAAVMKLPDKKAFRKNKRGHMAVSSCNDLLAVRWNDNNAVTVLTNCDEVEPKKKSSRYSRAEKKTVNVEVPGPIAKYNANMGGVDLCDHFVSTYRCGIRSKKWWRPFFAWTVYVCCVQGWLLYRRLGYDLSLLEFRRQCATNLLKTHGKPAVSPGVRPSLAFSSVLEEIRTDHIDHIIIKGCSKYRRCKVCTNRTSYVCKKCDAPLHPNECFKAFHTM